MNPSPATAERDTQSRSPQRTLPFYFGGSSKRPARIPGTVMSSSNSSQRSAKPFTSTSTCFSCCSVAAAKRRKRSAGNPTKRPSCSSIYIVLPSVQARTAAGSKEIGGSARMAFIICFFQFFLIFKNEAFDLSQVMRSYAPVACKKNGRLQPEFAVSVRRPDMDMRRLASLVGVEVKTERSDAHNGRHLSTIPHAAWIAWKYFFAEHLSESGKDLLFNKLTSKVLQHYLNQ